MRGSGLESVGPSRFDDLGVLKIRFARELGSSGPDLADILGIRSSEQRAFAPDEGRGIWAWLEDRRRLDLLPEALLQVGRSDLATALGKLPILLADQSSNEADDAPVTDPSVITTSILTHHSGRRWNPVYNEVRLGSCTDAIMILDDRDSPSTPVDILFVVFDGPEVIIDQVGHQALVVETLARVSAVKSLTAYVLVVGKQCEDAKGIVKRWLPVNPGKFYLEELRGPLALRKTMAECIQENIERDPRRRLLSAGAGIYHRPDSRDPNVGDF